MKKIYTAKQMMWGSFLGGPVAAIYFLTTGFDAIGRRDFAKRSLLIGIAAMFALIFLSPYIPDSVPSATFSILFAAPVAVLSKDYFLTKMQIEKSTEFYLQSTWKVFGIIILSVFLYVIISIVCFYFFESIGLINIE
ncbi:hypothetical protein MSP8886_02490 [Marinomonas spartinae]|uniref:Uncharacterized protein n=1 Tax=Marinomonas spartinae TaxID=1792290 RepID=A0A1A8TJB2_9GAMM|nr:hypothetical protein [Marinomonas spartinae]SBS32604.1 hypothetical protein MSP8886_02490 [Marinomonas spartinae]